MSRKTQAPLPFRMEPDDERVLRERAERQLPARRSAADDLSDPQRLRSERMLHELQVHELELAMQNEDLRNARADEADVLRCYIDLFDHAPVGYLTLNARGQIEQVNQRGAALLEVPAGTLVGRALIDHVVEADRPALQGALDTCRRQPGTFSRELRVGRQGRTTVQVEVRADPTGASLLVALVDISALQHAEASGRELQALQAANRRHGLQLTCLNQELRLPLDTIRRMSAALLEDSEHPLSAEQRQMLERIQQAGRQLQGLVDDASNRDAGDAAPPGGAPAAGKPSSLPPRRDEH